MSDFDGEIVFCRNPEQFGDGTQAVYLLPTNRPTFWLTKELPWMTRGDLEALIMAAGEKWAAVCDVKLDKAKSESDANFVITTASIDGPNGVLADMQLPAPGMRQQRMRIDVAESALASSLLLIVTHELGHAFALQHFPPGPPPELMEPSLNRSITGPQPTEAALMAKWYGLPKAEPAPPPQPAGTLVCTMRATPTADKFSCEITAEQNGRKCVMMGSKPWA